MKAVACYIRVSVFGKNQAGQRREINGWLQAHRIQATSVRWYIDKPGRGHSDQPEFERMQADIDDGKVGTVVVWRLDRISLTMRDGLSALCDWCDRSLRIVSVSQKIDFKGRSAKSIGSVLSAVAEMDQETRREQTMAGLEAARARGVYGGRRPGTTKVKPSEARKLRRNGMTPSKIATRLGVSRSTVYRYFES
jgi:DNA invertase Pin-like site-specific DNA recombinase